MYIVPEVKIENKLLFTFSSIDVTGIIIVMNFDLKIIHIFPANIRSDFNNIITSAFFSNSIRRHCFSSTIINDKILEEDEFYNIEINVVNYNVRNPNTMINFIIRDDDCE